MPKNPHANFKPTLESYSGQGAFKFWCQMALPLTYDDSLSYYELLNKVVTYLNNTIEDVGKVEDNVAALNEAYGKLEDYVNTYFDEIDIEAELRNVLDAMAEDGSLDSLLDPLVAARLGDVVAEQISGVVANQIGGAVSEQIDEAVLENLPAVVPDAVGDWLDENITPTTPVVDNTLSISGAAADAKVTGDKITDLKNAIQMFDEPVYTWTLGKYYHYQTGAETANDSYVCCEINIRAIPYIKVTTAATNPAGIVFFDDNGDYISGIEGTSGNLVTTVLPVPANAKSIGISCVVLEQNNAKIEALIGEQISPLYTDKIGNAYYCNPMPLTPIRGIMNVNGTLYDPSENYTGNHVSAHFEAGEKIAITGYSANASYPAMVIFYDDNTRYSNFTNTNTAYKNRLFTMPKAGTVYVNGNNYLTFPILSTYEKQTQESVNSILINAQHTKNATLKAMVRNNGILLIKKRISDTMSIGVAMGHVGANSLFGFSTIRQIAETAGAEMSDDFDDNGNIINAASTDWFGPYCVQALNNADGDVPLGNNYFTGGNHRTTNMATGGGITAAEESYSVRVGGVSPVTNIAYLTDEIVVKWANLVQANNTSKSDGTGRAVLRESWTLRIDKDGFHVTNDIEALEDIKLIKYYGLQVYSPSAQVIFEGGTNRIASSIQSAQNSGNKTCRSINTKTGYFNIGMNIEPIDLGLFENSAYSFFTTSDVTKVYSFLVGSDLRINEGEHYYLKGGYTFTV